MSRSRILYDRHGKFAEYENDELVWVRPDRSAGDAQEPSPQVIRDLEPYQSMIDGSMIDGRKRHRDHLKAHGCVEIGNDTTHATRPAAKPASHKKLLSQMLGDVSERELQHMVKREIEKHR
jgi:hypothetical protein